MLLSWSNFFGALLVLRQHMPGVFNHLDHPKQQKQNKTEKNPNDQRPKKSTSTFGVALFFLSRRRLLVKDTLLFIWFLLFAPLSEREGWNDEIDNKLHSRGLSVMRKENGMRG